MRVYVVIKGEKYEGGIIVSIHSSLDSAKRAAKSVDCLFEGGWKSLNTDTNYWVNGCDFLEIQSYEVEE